MQTAKIPPAAPVVLLYVHPRPIQLLLYLPKSPVFWLLVACVLVQLFYAAYYFWPFANRPAEAAAAAEGPDSEPVSIVVCARNEL